MVADTLVGPDVRGATKLIQLLDERGLSPRTAFWLKRSPERGWRLFLSPPVGREPLAYKRELAELYVLVKSRMFGADFGQISVLEANDVHERALRRLVGTFENDVVSVIDTVSEDVFLHEAVVLRMS